MKQRLIKTLNEFLFFCKSNGMKPEQQEEIKQRIKDVEQGYVSTQKFHRWLMTQADYEREKDREYADFLYQLAGTYL